MLYGLLKFSLFGIVPLAGSFVYTFTPTAARSYAGSVEQVRAQLAPMSAPFLLSSAELSLKLNRPDRMEWDLGEQGAAARVIARLTPSADRKLTTVKVDIERPASARSQLNGVQTAASMKLFEAVMVEQVDSTLNKRAYQWARVMPQFSVATVLTFGTLQQKMRDDLDRHVAAQAQREKSGARQ
ncbi:hypothetical protein [Methylopila sp. M107]|uniref:hypothetical protein n=1 Tax=Methylopila sp. M107 TaxID=1101190 RepID=UPI0003763D33|nr:hypothetical protein [Methylopila sp. M107]